MKRKYNKANAEMVQQILRIGRSSFSHYAAAGLIRPDNNCLFTRDSIYKALGIKQQTDEPLIYIDDVAKILGIPPIQVVPYIKRTGSIPYYSLKDGKGCKYYFLRSEIDAARAAKFRLGVILWQIFSVESLPLPRG